MIEAPADGDTAHTPTILIGEYVGAYRGDRSFEVKDNSKLVR